MNTVLLENHLEPLRHLLDQSDINEISINRPEEVWVERQGTMSCEKIPALTLQHLKDLAKLVATYTEQMISEEHPLLSANLPQGHRIQIAYPPIVNNGTIGISIRRASVLEHNLENYQTKTTNTASTNTRQSTQNRNDDLKSIYDPNEPLNILKIALQQKRNIVISGGTSTGKTTFLNALLKEIPNDERIITIEDVPEIKITQPNGLSLFASRNQQGRAKIDMQHLVEASLRLRPDRIIIGELRGAEAFSFLRAINTGHPGSVATLHANTPQLALEQLILMVMQKNLGLSHEEIGHYVRSIVDVVVQLKKGENGERLISELYII